MIDIIRSFVNVHKDLHSTRVTVSTCSYNYLLIVSGIREFHCKLCNYKGVTQSDLNRHTKSQIHMMKSQNECAQCGEGFVSPKNLERHVEERHLGVRRPTATMDSEGGSTSGTTYRQHLPYVDEKQIQEAERAALEEKQLGSVYAGRQAYTAAAAAVSGGHHRD